MLKKPASIVLVSACFRWTIIAGIGSLTPASHGMVHHADGEYVCGATTYRPRLIIRRINIYEASDTPLEIKYEIANIGGTKAKDLQISAMVWLPDTSHSIPRMPQYATSVPHPVTIESGDKYYGKCVVAAETAEEFGFRQTQLVGDPPISVILSCIYFLGYFVYQDQLDRRFETAFFRRYDPRTNRFSPVDDPDYEYLA